MVVDVINKQVITLVSEMADSSSDVNFVEDQLFETGFVKLNI